MDAILIENPMMETETCKKKGKRRRRKKKNSRRDLDGDFLQSGPSDNMSSLSCSDENHGERKDGTIYEFQSGSHDLRSVVGAATKNRRRRKKRNSLKTVHADVLQSEPSDNVQSLSVLDENQGEGKHITHNKLECKAQDLKSAIKAATKRKRRRRNKKKRKKVVDANVLQSEQNTNLASLTPVDEICVQVEDGTLNKLQTKTEDLRFADEGATINEEKTSRCATKVLEKKVSHTPLEGQQDNHMSLNEVSPVLNERKIKKFVNKLEQVEEKSPVSGIETTAHSCSNGKTLNPTKKVNNLLEATQFSPQKALAVFSKRKLLVLDVNGLLADIVHPPPKECKADVNIFRRAIFKRPFYYDFLKFCFHRFDVGIWSSRSKRIIDGVVDYLFRHMKRKLLFVWDASKCTATRFNTLENRHKPLVFKELRKLWDKHDSSLPWEKGDYNESNTLLLDDSPYKALLNPMHTAIFPITYTFMDSGDNSLGPGGDLRVYLERLAAVDNIPEYVRQHPFGQRQIDESSSSWGFYCQVIGSQSAANV